ncbi:phage tail protein [Pseudomonas sp. MH2]|uniref:Phage tail protein n=1 Tax=Pseudomonas machongensis TaxID=3110229 RepID=A0ABU5VA06_9PSED|nr:phage tail protein [Pseudomonas sp. MH2]MEA5670206.1 phage tail protein [Pseudomonas sp. MH2]
MARITLAGESLIAQKQGAKEVLHITRFIYANVPGLDPAKPIDRAAAKPPTAQIVHTYEIPAGNSGYVNPNQVVYSSMLGSDIGDFDWNWLGLESAEGVLFAVAYLPLQQKRRNIPPVQIGNNVTRNILVEYTGAQELTGIAIDASTWQHDFTVRLAGIDERERLSNRDVYGRACFFNEALQVIGAPATGYQVMAGTAYVEGIRLDAKVASIIPPALPTTAWLDVVLERQFSDVVARSSVVFGGADAFGDWEDALGVQHYCVPLADLSAAGVVDRRGVEKIDGPLVKHFASRKSVQDLEDGTTPAGKAKQLATPRTIEIIGAAQGTTQFDGSKDVSLHLVMSDNGIKAGTYTKVQVNRKGMVEWGGDLTAADIPSLDWSKINSGKPTTLDGYGITDALKRGEVGLGASKAPIGSIDSPGLPGGFYSFTEGPTSLANYCSVLVIPYASGTYSGQLAFQQGGSVVRMFARSIQNNGSWTPTVEIFHTGNLSPDSIVPPGTMIQTFSRKAPPGTLRANGAAVSRTTFARLFAELGTLYGAGDGVSTFNLPDTRGLFIRDVDDGRGFDPGRIQATVQYSQNLNHTHTASTGEAGWHYHPNSWIGAAGEHTHTAPRAMNNNVGGGSPNFTTANYQNGSTAPTDPAGAHTHSLGIVGDGVHVHSVNVGVEGGHESRPVNVALYTYIKY